MSTKEGIYVWKKAMDSYKSSDHIALTFEKVDKFLARTKRNFSEIWLNKFIQIPSTRNCVPANLWGGSWNSFGECRKLLYKYHKLSEDQVTVLAWYYWGGNNAQCIKVYPLVTVTFYFTAVDPELHRAKEKQRYRICAEMVFQTIKNKVPKKDFDLYMVESYRFLFTYNSNRDKIGDSVIVLKIILNNIKPIPVTGPSNECLFYQEPNLGY